MDYYQQEFSIEEVFTIFKALAHCQFSTSSSISAISKINHLVRQYKDELYNQLKALGEKGFLEGDGILKLDSDYPNIRYRVFVKGFLGTEYIGEFQNYTKASEAWVKKHQLMGNKREFSDVEVWVWNGERLCQKVEVTETFEEYFQGFR